MNNQIVKIFLLNENQINEFISKYNNKNTKCPIIKIKPFLYYTKKMPILFFGQEDRAITVYHFAYINNESSKIERFSAITKKFLNDNLKLSNSCLLKQIYTEIQVKTYSKNKIIN